VVGHVTVFHVPVPPVDSILHVAITILDLLHGGSSTFAPRSRPPPPAGSPTPAPPPRNPRALDLDVIVGTNPRDVHPPVITRRCHEPTRKRYCLGLDADVRVERTNLQGAGGPHAHVGDGAVGALVELFDGDGALVAAAAGEGAVVVEEVVAALVDDDGGLWVKEAPWVSMTMPR
jgi:hypothetical protein